MIGIGISMTQQVGRPLGSDPLAFFTANGFTPKLAADFQQESGTELLRAKGQNRLFSAMFPSFSRAGLATMVDSDGVLKWAPHNLATYSEQLDNADWSDGSAIETNIEGNVALDPEGVLTADRITFTAQYKNRKQFISTSAGAMYTAEFWVKNEDGNTSLHVIHEGSAAAQTTPVTITNTWSLVSATFLGNASNGNVNLGIQDRNASGWGSILVAHARVYRSDLGGMVNNPDRGDSYVPTTTAARYLPRRNHHVWDGSAWVNKGLRYETEARTNLLLNSGTLATQDVTVTNEPHTIHFTGTGSITLSGASTAGPLVGTGTGEGNRVSLTFTPTAGTLTCTVSGTVTNAQLEIGATPSSYIPTAGAAATRAAESGLTIPSALMPWNAAGVSIAMAGRMTYADASEGVAHRFVEWGAVGNRIFHYLQTTGVDVGEIHFQQSESSTTDDMSGPTDSYSPGINVPFSIAGRHTPSLINGAVDGTALTADTTPTALVDLSATDFNLATDFMGNIGKLLVFANDIEDAGIEATTS